MENRIQLISAALGKCAMGRPISILKEADSTNDILKNLSDQGAPEGYTVVADSQLKGRGRMGRNWLSLAEKGLYMSVLLRPNLPVSESSSISMLSALAVAHALKRAEVPDIALKWPNDVLAGNKKIAGILVEPETRAGIMRYCIVGIGVNVSCSERDLSELGPDSATSCLIEGSEIERDLMLVLVLEEMDKFYRLAMGSNMNWLTAEWTKLSKPQQENNGQ